MSEEAKPKVVSLRSRKPYEPPPPEMQPDPDGIDRASILMLKDVNERLEKGEFSGCVTICFAPESSSFEIFVGVPIGANVRLEAVKFLGAMELVKDQLANLHLFGDEPIEDEDLPEGQGA